MIVFPQSSAPHKTGPAHLRNLLLPRVKVLPRSPVVGRRPTGPPIQTMPEGVAGVNANSAPRWPADREALRFFSGNQFLDKKRVRIPPLLWQFRGASPFTKRGRSISAFVTRGIKSGRSTIRRRCLTDYPSN